jgi:hypothetical protein
MQQAGLNCSGRNTSLATRGTAMEIRKQNDKKQEAGKSTGSLTLKRTIQRKLNMDHLKSHLILEPSKKMERE